MTKSAMSKPIKMWVIFEDGEPVTGSNSKTKQGAWDIFFDGKAAWVTKAGCKAVRVTVKEGW